MRYNRGNYLGGIMTPKRELADRLKWLLNFANLDIAGLNYGEFIMQLFDFLNFITYSLDNKVKDTKENRENLIKAQKTARDILTFFAIERGPHKEGYKQLGFKIRLVWDIRCIDDNVEIDKFLEEDPNSEELSFRIEKDLRYSIRDVQSRILFALMPIFEQIEISRILLCPKCGQFELTTKKKQRDLCSRCLSKERVAKMRAKDKKEFGKVYR